MKRAFIGLGANLGPSLETLKQAALQLAEHPLISAFQLSPLYKSKPVDSQGPDYVNAVASLRTSLEPVALLALLQEMEQAYGRQRPYRNAPRTLDLDLLLYEGVKLNTDVLTVPHPRMHLRAFVLQPLHDLAPELALDQGSLAALLKACRHQEIERLS
ncbi:2-amino-4-hydroxy-6-hydroxymethyldihydropteridine diphosphokinase [Neopusillimonas maritima]|uniref:2-amino-4-hydroxy-6-hydroxymethyldihydropteridine pyrophosphokinase n=1 Tax=Neopusillimonas maritima TaxID=2026239 RepID=A0A3A1YU09_9BURK|nr:2-amino-4-hydroxy-6-hydroxymethyldihydropteridine diphosphokinase [Neopusillimonas maritima]RIY40739.1 2-amino-4-hydroxy-6-hydroxymethyldihydropteridine diphosphokinase [Neopusillimonas maritima]